MTAHVPRWASMAVLSSGFRPFYVLGPVFGLAAIALWLVGYMGLPGGLPALFSQPQWHGHEMIYGFAGAMCGGFILTALPSWAGTPAVTGRPLLLLVGLWLLGRVAIMWSASLTPGLVAGLDLMFMPLLAIVIAPSVWAAKNRLYRLVLPVLGGFIAGNLVFHYGLVTGEGELIRDGVRLGYYSLVVLYCIFAGLLTPIFSETWLKERRAEVAAIPIRPVVEVLALLGVIGLAVADMLHWPAPAVAIAAGAAVAINLIRMKPWRTRLVLGSPLLLPMHLGYLCLIAALALRGVTAFLSPDDPSAAVHAFTIGAWGLTKFSLMVRVSLKHTGRPLAMPNAMKAALVLMGLAALARVLAGFGVLPGILLPSAAVLWLTPLGIYFVTYGPMLLRPSRPARSLGARA